MKDNIDKGGTMSKIAYLIGINQYENWGRLRNPLNDLDSMEKSLLNLGFTVRRYENLDWENLNNVVKAYPIDLFSSKESIFYFSGHGVEVNGKQYLIPTDANALPSTREVDDDILSSFVDITSTINRMPRDINFTNIFIFDCCRESCRLIENEYFRGANSSETIFDAKHGTLISFSTSPNSTASDGKDSNGLFTKHLLENINTPNLRIEELFKRVRLGVMTESNHKQIPWEHSSLIGEFYFVDKTTDKDAELSFDEIILKLYNEKLSISVLKERAAQLYEEFLVNKNPILDGNIYDSESKFVRSILRKIDELHFSEKEN